MSDWIVKHTQRLLLGPYVILMVSLLAPEAWNLHYLGLLAGATILIVAVVSLVARFVNWRRAGRRSLANHAAFEAEVERIAAEHAGKRLKLGLTERG